MQHLRGPTTTRTRLPWNCCWRWVATLSCVALFLILANGTLDVIHDAENEAQAQWARLGEREAALEGSAHQQTQQEGQRTQHADGIIGTRLGSAQKPLGKLGADGTVDGESTDGQKPIELPINPLEQLHYALETMQEEYFELWLGTWPSAIDWTAAVMGTFVSASLNSLTRSLEYILPLGGTSSASRTASSDVDKSKCEAGEARCAAAADQVSAEGQRIENEINLYFSQTISYYFGENAFSIRTQAYDDMLWVVLGWLENIRFINLHTHNHYPSTTSDSKSSTTNAKDNGAQWYGKQFEPAYAHRARVFYDLASKGWDTSLCDGGMVWNPHLMPYKNAITNQLYIAASMGMYLYFPGDKNQSPFSTSPFSAGSSGSYETASPTRPYDPIYLRNAVEAYAWLSRSNMTNTLGLFVDGFHIHNWGRNNSIGTGQCDVRNEMVYTYNQGVLLSGLRGLWEGTGSTTYLSDGHKLVRSVIKASGFDLTTQRVVDGEKGRRWQGLGRAGILEELCDSSFRGCTQNGQTFKGIFFHHLTTFCEPLPLTPTMPGRTHGASREVESMHRASCKEYAPWVARNARAALNTRDRDGRFGGWWGAGLDRAGEEASPPLPAGAVDYRNDPRELEREPWLRPREGVLEAQEEDRKAEKMRMHGHSEDNDPNDRGRGRTVETQGGGVAVLRAMWELVHMYQTD